MTLFNLKKTAYILMLLSISANLFAQNDYINRLKKLSGQPDTVEKFIKIAKIYEQTGYDKKAIENYKKALALKPSIELMEGLSKVYDRSGQLRKAIALRQIIIKNDSSRYITTYKLAQNYAKIYQKDSALILLEKLEQIDSLNPNYPYKTGLYEKNMNRKLDAFLRAYRLDSTHKMNLLMLAKNYKAIKFIDSSDYYLQKALILYPFDTKILRQQVITDYRKKDFNSMLKHLKTLDSLQYEPMFVHKNLGLVYLQLNYLERASKHLDTAINISRSELILYYYKALVNEKQGHLKRAKKYLKNAIHFLKPEWGKEYYELGIIAKKQKRYKEALSYFEKATQYRSYPDADLQKAMIWQYIFKNYKKALGYYQKYVNSFKHKDKNNLSFAQSQIKTLKTKIFMSKPGKK